MQNSLFVGYKPPNLSSQAYANFLKRKFKLKKIGYSGTLDPFAKGAILMASGSATKLLNFITTSPKVYIATLWLGAESKSLDITQISRVEILDRFKESEILGVLDSMKGKIDYTPPVFSAKKINGIRAYKLAREGKSVELKNIEMEVFDIELLNYSHPFLSFKASVSKGSYIRSLGEIIAKKLGTFGALSFLERVSEGKFRFNNYELISPFSALEYPILRLDKYRDDIKNGRKIKINSAKNGRHIAIFDEFFSIIELDNGEIKYLLNNCKRI